MYQANLCQNDHFSMFSVFGRSFFIIIAKVKINIISDFYTWTIVIINLSVEIGKKILLALYGGKYLLMHVALYICNEMTWYTFWEQNDHEKGKLLCKRIRSKTDKSLITVTHTFFLSLT